MEQSNNEMTLTRGTTYRVKKDISKAGILSGEFKPGERVIYVNSVHGIYESATKYSFRPLDRTTPEVPYVQIYDGDPEPNWAEYFEEISSNE